MKKYVILDSESNGGYVDAEVWQIAWQVTDCHFNLICRGGGYLAPIARMDSKAKQITGLDRAFLKKNAEPADGLYSRLLRDILGSKAVVGHSIDVDVERIIRDAKVRCKPALAERVCKVLSSKPQYDTMSHTVDFVNKVIRKTCWYRGVPVFFRKIGFPSLVDLARKLGVTRDDLLIHSAVGDVELTRRCMAEMRTNHRDLVRDLMHGEIDNPNPDRPWILDT